MSIHFISGKPGGGKTLYSVRLIIEELVHGSRTVITNVPLLLPRLNEFLQEKYPKEFEKYFCNNGHAEGKLVAHQVRKFQFQSLHITDRVILLTEDDLPKFFTFRPNAVRLASVTNAEWKTGKRPDFSVVKDGGVLYVLDEVHIAFNARAWAETGHEVLYYLSQHRKLGDDVICITQAIGNVDKQFRSVAQDFTYIKNLSKQKAGWFRLPAIFTRNTYAQPATDNSKPMETGSFTMDVSGIASCYDTAKGVGIHGRAGADTKSRKKGIHWLWFVICVPVLVWVLFQYLPLFIARVTEPKRPHSSAPASQSAVANPASQSPGATENELGRTASHSGPDPDLSQKQPQTNELYCVSYYVFPGEQPAVTLSDGNEYGPPDLELIAKRYVVVNGRKIRMRIKQPDYLSPPLPVYDLPPSSPQLVNQADVTVIGDSYRQRTAPPRVGGFASMGRK